MKKIVILGLLVFAGWKLYQDQFSVNGNRWGDYDVEKVGRSTDGLDIIKLSPAKKPAESSQVSHQKFKCDGRQHCSQMNSREEADFFIENCPNTKMDGDHDGIPCENDSRF
ncbi:excalibur calcium-binding domain-containing protein [Microbulbifer bruguierae]|uniref:Excalibur calcium-binding domain-containing protein n=1 Tax=Microbulbifer bruguierae TaxID=3029061 RepID=A0ABY8NAF7_9GAMM|nr:excalibur calcium-binding domain-containing protein [Microbulbifer bruguierae]WGL15900.1 excalibur calcium-binding domain-containing protein [Microbulbifer bruguierae]